jgi:hypothetical protein
MFKANQVLISPELTREQQYLARQQNLKIPFTPVEHREEKPLFARLTLQSSNVHTDAEEMASEWQWRNVLGIQSLPANSPMTALIMDKWAIKCISDLDSTLL